ncbi:hypothetical protein EV363DRAFT_1172988 [Boletus edulis]|nr:hypothetical protein EV363DRAFT_1172988 [Boletus edulis]
MAGFDETDRHTTGNKGCSDALGTSIMMTVPLQSVNAESGENSSQNSPGQRSEDVPLKGTCFSVFDAMVASDRFCIVF